MATSLIRLWSEWDIGHEDLLFSTKGDAKRWLEQNRNVEEILDGEGVTLDGLFDEGLLGYREVELWLP